MTSTIAYESAVAAAFASRLPTAAPTVAVASQASGDTGDAVIVGYVGAASAQLAVQVLETDALIDGLPDAPLVERVAPGVDRGNAAHARWPRFHLGIRMFLPNARQNVTALRRRSAAR